MNQQDPFAERWQRLAERWETNSALPSGLRALVTEINAVRSRPAIPEPDLSFLPPLSLATYVRQVGEQISRLHFPDVSGGLQAAADRFFGKLNPQQPRLLLESKAVYLSDTPDPMKVFTTTYVTMVRLLDDPDSTLRRDSAQLALAAYEVAFAEAQRQGLEEEDADRFAAGFADLLRRTATMFGRIEAPPAP